MAFAADASLGCARLSAARASAVTPRAPAAVIVTIANRSSRVSRNHGSSRRTASAPCAAIRSRYSIRWVPSASDAALSRSSSGSFTAGG